MSIEWWWSRSHEGWSDPQISESAPAPYLEAWNGSSFVVVEGRRHRTPPGPELFLTLAGVAILYGGLLSRNLFGALGLILIVPGIMLTMRYSGLTRHSALLSLSPVGVTCDGLTVPWPAINRVVHTRLGGPAVALHRRWPARRYSPPFRMWNLICLEINEFDAVRGLRPFMTGLADLNHPRRIVLAETGELRDPRTLYAVLDHLISHPEDRELLDGDAGLDLVTYGPSLRRSS